MSTLPNTPRMAVPQSVAKNPLAKLFRQPAIYFMPPSQGRWWPQGSMRIPETGEFAVYPMTSRDEITLRTPDALLNGQGMIDVISSCVPDIINAWDMPATDVDAVLIAIRIASYGHKMDLEATCTKCEEMHTYALDLRGLLDGIRAPDFETPHQFEELTIKLKPQAYYSMNKANRVNFEVQKLSQALEALEDDNQKTDEAIKQMNRLVELNFEVVTECTEWISSNDNPAEKITDKGFIMEFYKNIPSGLASKIQMAYTELAKAGAVPTSKTICAGCNEPLEIAVQFDYANFFAAGS